MRNFKLLNLIIILFILVGCNKQAKLEINPKEAVSSVDTQFSLEQNGWLFFTNKNDNYKIYKVKKGSNELFKINDDNSIIVKVVDYYIIYINKSDNSKLYRVSIDGSERFEMKDTFSNNGWIYFNTLTQIFKVKNDGTKVTNIYTRDISGTDMKITEVEDEWIYFNVTSEDGISVERVKSDGTGYEHLRQLPIEE